MTFRGSAAVLGTAALLLAGCSNALPGDGAVAPPASSAAAAAESTAGPAPAPTSARPAASKPVTTPCTRNHRPKLVFVSLTRQHLWLCARTRVVRDTPITSGALGDDTETPTGHYVIQGRNRDTTLTLASGETYDVKFWIPFDAPLFGFHDSSWQHFPYGSPRYKTEGSHGCVHVPLAALRFLYDWADIGTPVTIRG